MLHTPHRTALHAVISAKIGWWTLKHYSSEVIVAVEVGPKTDIVNCRMGQVKLRALCSLIYN